jgi:uncharacterized membrane protein YjjB (DUF3815 family)
MNARNRLASAFPWVTAVAVGVGIGLGLTAYFIDEHANKTCGLIPSTVGLVVLIPSGLGVAALAFLIVAIRADEHTRRVGLWLLIVSALAAALFVIAALIAFEQIPAGCHRNG